MGRDNQPRERQLRRLASKNAQRPSYARILIVTEGSKTERLYLEEIRAAYQLHSTNVEVQRSQAGTAPAQVVRYAAQLFERGDQHRGIRPKSFDQVYAVFDRDDHSSYFEALDLARSLDRRLRNDEKQPVKFRAITSIPSFELWLLLHYEEVLHPITRDEVMRRLKRHIPSYAKGAGGLFANVRMQQDAAILRSRALAARFDSHSDPEPFTAMYELVELLTTLRN